MASFKSSISRGNYVSPAKAHGAWPDMVISRKIERHMPSEAMTNERQAKIIIRRKDGTRYVPQILTKGA